MGETSQRVVVPYTCAVCSARGEGAADRLYCSARCRNHAAYKRSRADPARFGPRLVPFVCAQCGHEGMGKPQKRYCSGRCRTAYHRRGDREQRAA